VPAGLNVHVICDKSSTRDTAETAAGCCAIPVSSCTSPDLQLLAEPGGAVVCRADHKWFRRGTHRSVAELEQAIQAWIDT
jgi:hypothetical protein